MGRCWRCGKKIKTQNHHAIPKALKPMWNKTVPVCKDCHVDINHFYAKQYGHDKK